MQTFHEKYKKQVEVLADRMRGEAMPKLTEELFALFETTGNRLKYEEVYFLRRKFLAVFGMAAHMFKRPEDVEKLSEVLAELCTEECWALPAHVNRGADKNWRNTVDLFASETAQSLAEVVTLVNGELPEENKLPEEVCRTVQQEIEKRVLRPFLAATPRYGNWECSDHNWNAVCCGSIGSAAMYLLAGKEEERLQKCLNRICHSLTYYLDGFREDGACMEGIGYFTYGMTYFVGFAEQLLRYSGGKINLFEKEKLRKIAEFQQKTYFTGGQTVSFSDGDKQAKFRMGLTRYLAGQYDTVRVPKESLACDFESDSCYRFMGLMRDYLWTKDMEEKEKTGKEAACAGQEKEVGPIARHDVLPVAQWSICESENGVGFAIKGGDNGEPHNHNDIGSFLYLVGTEQLITDLGAGEYTKEYFSAGRYNILCNSSLGHSVPSFGGELQKDGKEFCASGFFADGRGTTRIEFANAYGDTGVDRLVREAAFSLKDGSLQITDEVTFFKQADDMTEGPGNAGRAYGSITEQLVTQGEVELRADGVHIMGATDSCLVKLPEEIQNLRVIEKAHSNHEGEPETVRLIQWDIARKQGERRISTGFTVIPFIK